MSEHPASASWASSSATRKAMQGNRRRDTSPELALRRELHRRGFRYFVDRPLEIDRRRRADIVFPTRKVVVFVDGCFWHRCPLHATQPVRNADFWQEKLTKNVARDRDTDRRLRDLGWSVVRVWEHEQTEAAADRVARALARPG